MNSLSLNEKKEIRELLCDLGDAIQAEVISQREKNGNDELSRVSHIAESDTIYSIDNFSEEALLKWFSSHWPDHLPVEVVAEGFEDSDAVLFPVGTRLKDTIYKVIIDPIDGTRELMYDKRSAWALAGVAPQKFSANRIGDIEVAMMTELPISKQTLADQVSGYSGCGKDGLVADRRDLKTGMTEPILLTPSTAKTVDHGVAGLVKFFPEGKELIAKLETELWKKLGLFGVNKSPVVFDDQYISTGGQMYALLSGQYRFYGDLRPEALTSLGLASSLTCHPYDVAAGLLLTEAGCIYEFPSGGAVDAPMDTVTPVTWVAYANSELAKHMRPVLQELMRTYFGK